MPGVDKMVPRRQSLMKSGSLVSLMTLMSRLMGFVRDMVIAQFFGATAGVDAFIVAFRIPNFMRRLFAEGAFSQAFVPVLAEYQQTKDREDVRTFMARVAGQLSAALGIVTIIGVLAAPLIVYIFAPGFGFGSDRFLLATEMLRLTFPYLMLVSLTAMAGAVLNTYGYFGIPAFTPVLLNISLILGAWYLAPISQPPVKALAVGVLVAGFAQLLFQLPFLWRHGLLVRPQLARRDPGVKKVLMLMVPALFGVSIAQLNLMVDSIFASFLQVSSVSWLYYTDRLTDFPLGVFGVAVATVILPHLSRQYTAQQSTQYTRALDWGMRMLLLLGVPAALGLIIFAEPLIACCFGYGRFSLIDVMQTRKSLMALSVGVPAFMIVKVLASGFYARQNIKTPVKVGALAMLINSLLCAVLIWPMAHAGLALASALAGYVNCGLLFYLLRREGIYQAQPGWGRFLLQLGLASSLMSLYLGFMRHDAAWWMSMSTGLRLGLLLAHVLAAVVIYILVLLLTGLRLSALRGVFKES